MQGNSASRTAISARAIVNPAYRYVSALETAVITSKIPQRVPNIDRFGRPKIVYMSWDLYGSTRAAEAALLIGALNPSGATASPADGLELDLTGISYISLGVTPGGGTELTTTMSPLVTDIFGLTP